MKLLRYVSIGLVSLVIAGSIARAGQTPRQTYAKTKADLEKLWAGEKKLIQAGIDFHSKTLANLRKARSKCKPQHKKLKHDLDAAISKHKSKLREVRAHMAKREKEVAAQIEAAASGWAKAHRDLEKAGKDLKKAGKEIERLAKQAERDAAAFRAKIEQFKKDFDAKVAEYQSKVAAVSGKYTVTYDFSKIETNLGGKKQTVTLAQLRKTHLGGNPKAPLVPAELCNQIMTSPRRVEVHAQGLGFVLSAKRRGKTGRLPGLINYKTDKFLGGGSGGHLVTRLGTLLHTLTVDGDLKLGGKTQLKGRVISALTLWNPQGAGGIYVSVPFTATKTGAASIKPASVKIPDADSDF